MSNNNIRYSYVYLTTNKINGKNYVGHESNRITAITMYEWLRKSIQREAAKKFSTYAYQQSYCLGIVSGLYEKYGQKKEDAADEAGLVIYNEVDDWVKQHKNMKVKSCFNLQWSIC